MPHPDPIQLLQVAARRVGGHLAPDVRVSRVIVQDETGRVILDTMVPLRDPIEAKEAVSEPAEVRPGWDFSRAIPRFDGEEKPVHGRMLAVLRALAEADGPASTVGAGSGT